MFLVRLFILVVVSVRIGVLRNVPIVAYSRHQSPSFAKITHRIPFLSYNLNFKSMLCLDSSCNFRSVLVYIVSVLFMTNV